jgi:signal transduction histidine kinase
MTGAFECRDCGETNSAFKAMTEAVLGITAELSVERILQKIVDTARELVGARYAALGVPDDAGGFSQFIVSGIDEETWDAIGTLPRQHGILGLLLSSAAPYRFVNIQEDARFGGWPDEHPDMRSFLGVPIISKGSVIGSFYLTEKLDGAEFDDGDQQLIEMLASHAAVAIENARLYERSRELSVVEERNRLARELHDSVTQTLFSVVLTAEAAATLADRDTQQAKAQIARLQELARDALQEMRSLIFELRPAELEKDGLVPTLRKHVDVLRRVSHAEVELHVDGERRFRAPAEREVFRIVQEALNNALKHSRAGRVWIEVAMGKERVSLRVCDDGVGFDPQEAQARSKRLGLTSMQERAEAIGGTLLIDSQSGRGTKVCLEVPLAG